MSICILQWRKFIHVPDKNAHLFYIVAFHAYLYFQQKRNKDIFYRYHLWIHCGRSIWHILISGSVSVYCRDVVGLLSVYVRNCRSAVSYDSSIVFKIGFQSVSCRLSIGLKSGDSLTNLTRNDPDMNPIGLRVSFGKIVGGRQLPDSMKIIFAVFVGFVLVWPVWLGYSSPNTCGNVAYNGHCWTFIPVPLYACQVTATH